MRRRAFIAAIPATLAFARAANAAFAAGDAVQLRVRAGGGDLDAAVYEAVFPPFAEAMPLKRQPPFTHTLDITFASTGHDWFNSDHDPSATPKADAPWYVGDRPAIPSETHVGGVEWQTSRMRAVLRRLGGEPVWSADYTYNGGMELSGWTVKTPAQAARLIARRLAARLKAKPELIR